MLLMLSLRVAEGLFYCRTWNAINVFQICGSRHSNGVELFCVLYNNALDNKLTITYITVYASEFKAEKSKVTLLLAKQAS